MSDVPPEQRGPRFEAGAHAAEGKVPALIVWALYGLSLPSANMLVVLGIIVAYVARGGATGVARQHLDSQIAMFWSIVWWSIALWIVTIVSFVTIILFPLGLLGLFLLFVLHLWLTVKSIFGLINLLGDRAP